MGEPAWADTARFMLAMAVAVILILGGLLTSDLALVTLGVGTAGLPSYMKATAPERSS